MPLMVSELPKDTVVVSQIIEKTLKNGMVIEVYLIKQPRQYEAALFVDGHFKQGPPLPRPLESPSDSAAYWMGVRPKIGFTQEEGEEIIAAVNVQNKIHHCCFMDKWGVED